MSSGQFDSSTLDTFCDLYTENIESQPIVSDIISKLFISLRNNKKDILLSHDGKNLKAFRDLDRNAYLKFLDLLGLAEAGESEVVLSTNDNYRNLNICEFKKELEEYMRGSSNDVNVAIEQISGEVFEIMRNQNHFQEIYNSILVSNRYEIEELSNENRKTLGNALDKIYNLITKKTQQ